MPPTAVPVDWEIAADPQMQQIVRRGTEEAHPRFRAFGACRMPRPRTGAGVLVPVYRRRRGKPDRPSAHRAGARRRAGSAALRFRVLRALRTGVFLGLPPSRGREPRPRAVSRRLHLRVRQPMAGQGAPAQRRGRGDRPAHLSQPARAIQDRPGPAGPACSRRRVSRPGTTTRCRTTTPTTVRRISTIPSNSWQRRAAAYQAFWEHMPLPLWARPRGPDATIVQSRRFWRPGDVSARRRTAVPLAAGLRCSAARRRQAAGRRRMPGAPRPAPLLSRQGDRKPGCTASSAARRRAGTSSRRDS